MYRMKLVLGDWSDDGHGRSDIILYECNHPVEKVQQAYKDSCKLTGVQFNINENYTGVKRDYPEECKYQICTEYDSSEIPETAYNMLVEACIDMDSMGIIKDDLDDTQFKELWWEFVKLSLPDLTYKEITDDTPVINGYWNNLFQSDK